MMNQNAIRKAAIAILTLVFVLTTILSGCGKADPSTETTEPAPTDAPTEAVETEPTQAPETEPTEPGMQDGERYEAVIVMEGMEETVQYEHIVNQTLGVEMDYDYERFERRSEPEREVFVSVWDDADNPENYLELTSSMYSVETVADSIRESLSETYDLNEVTRTLDRAGDCTFIEASVLKGTNNMADQLQMVYIIPADDGCRIATLHCAIEASEGFGRRFDYMLNTLTVLSRAGAGGLTEEEALTAVKNYCYAANPELEGIEQAGEYPVYWEIASSDAQQIVVLFRSYTGAQMRYYIDPKTGDCYVTEFVPGVSEEEQRTEETFNVRDYLSGSDAAEPLTTLAGTWQTASMGYEGEDGNLYPEYMVQFTESEIQYGHMVDGAFVLDHSDKISLIAEIGSGRYRVQATGANGVQYTFQTSESDTNVLEYYETWDENAFTGTYSAGASLVRSN